MGIMQIPMPKDNKCPKCGLIMLAEENAYALPLMIHNQGATEKATPIVLAHCPGCNYVELYLPRV